MPSMVRNPRVFSRKGAKLAKFDPFKPGNYEGRSRLAGSPFVISRLGLEVFFASFAPLREKGLESA